MQFMYKLFIYFIIRVLFRNHKLGLHIIGIVQDVQLFSV
jgi:hypothetical protein